MEPKKLTIELNDDDWTEIVCALNTKIIRIESGEYGPEEEVGADHAWIDHILAIIDKLEKAGVVT